MCTHQSEITNKYTGRKLYVKCGHCPACLQEKAAFRVSRIKNQDSRGLICLFVCLSYRRNAAPYILRDDGYKFSRGEIKTLPVYRDTFFRKVRQNSSYDIDYKEVRDTFKLCDVDFTVSSDFRGLKDLKHQHGHIGVTYYPDVQRFFARLRLNLKRNYNYEQSFKTYLCSEYGSKSHRPHFHFLLWCNESDKEIFRSAIIASWPYGDIQRFSEKAIQQSYRAASYVASYVNCGSDFPSFLQRYFKPKHSYSKGFGLNNPMLSVYSILQKFSRGHLTYNSLRVTNNGSEISELLIPKYAIHRYFPKFKGYGRLPVSTLRSCMERIRAISRNESSRWLGSSFYEYESDFNYTLDSFCPVARPLGDFDFLSKLAFPVFYSLDDIHKIGVRLDNAYNRFIDKLDIRLSFNEYCRLHTDVWSLYNSEVLRLHLQNEEIPLNEKYDNLENIRCDIEYNGRPYPVGFTREMFSVTDPNKFTSVMNLTGKFEHDYHDSVKHRRVNNSILMLENEEL